MGSACGKCRRDNDLSATREDKCKEEQHPRVQGLGLQKSQLANPSDFFKQSYSTEKNSRIERSSTLHRLNSKRHALGEDNSEDQGEIVGVICHREPVESEGEGKDDSFEKGFLLEFRSLPRGQTVQSKNRDTFGQSTEILDPVKIIDLGSVLNPELVETGTFKHASSSGSLPSRHQSINNEHGNSDLENFPPKPQPTKKRLSQFYNESIVAQEEEKKEHQEIPREESPHFLQQSGTSNSFFSSKGIGESIGMPSTRPPADNSGVQIPAPLEENGGEQPSQKNSKEDSHASDDIHTISNRRLVKSNKKDSHSRLHKKPDTVQFTRNVLFKNVLCIPPISSSQKEPQEEGGTKKGAQLNISAFSPINENYIGNSPFTGGWEFTTIDKLADIMKEAGSPSVHPSPTAEIMSQENSKNPTKDNSSFAKFCMIPHQAAKLDYNKSMVNSSRLEENSSIIENTSVITRKDEAGNKYINQYMIVKTLGKGSYGVIYYFILSPLEGINQKDNKSGYFSIIHLLSC